MRTRFAIGRCCCGGPTIVNRIPQLSGLVWIRESVDEDPLGWIQFNGTSFSLSGDTYDGADTVSIGGLVLLPNVPVQTYSTFALRFWGEVSIPNPHEEHQQYNLYVVNQPTWGEFSSPFFPDRDIERADLLGPVAWDDSAADWLGGLQRTTPNLATHVNTVVNDAAWVPGTSWLHIVFEVTDPAYAGTPPSPKTDRLIYYVPFGEEMQLIYT